jgi:hypothetical protein
MLHGSCAPTCFRFHPRQRRGCLLPARRRFSAQPWSVAAEVVAAALHAGRAYPRLLKGVSALFGEGRK